MKFPSFIVGLALVVCGCASSSVHRTWKSPTPTDGPVKKIAVVAVHDRDFYRASVESHFCAQLRKTGQNAIVTHDLLTLPAIKADKDAAAAKVRENGADAVLVIRLAGSRSTEHDVRATSYYVATTTGYETSDWYGYYSVAFADMGTVWASSQREVYLEISLFDLNSKQRLWSGQTESTLRDGEDAIKVLSDLADKVVVAVRKDGLIR